MRQTVTTWHLEMLDRAELRPPRRTAGDLDVRRVELPCPELNRFFYTAVGGDWFWTDRLPWSYEEWRAWVTRPEVETWTAWTRGSPVGYFELERQQHQDIEIVYFGLLAAHVGRGFGSALLAAAADRAWDLGARRVWVHTCSLDHPSALASYQARGFRVFQEETAEVGLPDEPPGPWPGARALSGHANGPLGRA